MELDLKIIVISLKNSSKRRANISKQLDKLDITYDFLTATDGAKITNEWIEDNVDDYLKNIYYNNEHYSVNKNALACADSHRRAQIIASNFIDGYTLILEDDVELSKNFYNKIIAVIETMKENSIHIAFPGYNLAKGDCKKRIDIDCSSLDFSFLGYPINGHVSGAYSYIVDAIGAKKLVDDNLEKIQRTADTFHIAEKGLSERTLLLYPKLVTTGYFDSDIGYVVPGINIIQRVKRIVYSWSLKSSTIHKFLRYKKERTM